MKASNHISMSFLWIQVLYMSSSFWLLGGESLDFSHAEKERTAYKMATIFTKNGPRLSVWVKNSCQFINLLSLQAVLSLSTWEKSCEPTSNSQKLEYMQSTINEFYIQKKSWVPTVHWLCIAVCCNNNIWDHAMWP